MHEHKKDVAMSRQTVAVKFSDSIILLKHGTYIDSHLAFLVKF